MASSCAPIWMREGVKLADYERWRIALEEDGRESPPTNKRIRQLERELARKEKAWPRLLRCSILKKTMANLHHDEDDDTDEQNEK